MSSNVKFSHLIILLYLFFPFYVSIHYAILRTTIYSLFNFILYLNFKFEFDFQIFHHAHHH